MEPKPIELTPEEQQLLERYGRAYRDLETGDRIPTTSAQEHFVMVTRGQAVAETPHEVAYAKLMRIRATSARAAWIEASQRREDEEPDSEWFSREDWKKLRSRQYGDMMNRSRND